MSRVLFGFTYILPANIGARARALTAVISTHTLYPGEMFLHILFPFPASPHDLREIYPPENLHDRRLSARASLADLAVDAFALFISFFLPFSLERGETLK